MLYPYSMFAFTRTQETGRYRRAAVIVLAALLGTLFCARVCLGAGYIMQFQTIGKSFAPAAYCDGTPQTFLWTWSDGTTSTEYPIISKKFGNSGSRTQYLTVDFPSALTNLNIGYDASDSGDTNNYTLRPPQEVCSVYFLQPLTNLQYWASSYNPITNTMDFSGFTAIQDIECWHCTNLQYVVVSNLPSLRRVCFEACALQELDLTGAPNLEDLRAALNNFTNIVVAGGTGPKIWHFCARDNPQLTQDFKTIMTNFYSLREPWWWNANQSGALSFVSSNLTDVEVFQNNYSSADFTGQSNMFELQIYDNVLTNLVIAGCTNLQDFEANGNLLPPSVIDTLLTFLDASCPQISYANLSQNSAPTGLGYTHFVNLINRGVNVFVDMPASFAPVLSVAATAILAEDCFPGNGAIDPGETVSLSFALNNTGIYSTTNLVVTLLAADGITAPTGPQSYGAIAGGGPAVARTFTFKASGWCGSSITASLQLQDGPSNLGTLSIPFRLGLASDVLAEKFDAVAAPALPLGWNTSASNAAAPWFTTDSFYDTASRSVFSPSATNIGINELVSPAIRLPSGVTQLSFAHAYDLEADAAPVGYDGGVLEIKIGPGAFTDILAASGTFITNGYNSTISSSFGSPIAGRQAWSGATEGFVKTVVNVPSAAAGQTVQFRWRCGSDSGEARIGWFIDSVLVTSQTCCDISAQPPPVMQSVSVGNGTAIVSCVAAPGKTYRLQYETNLQDANWIDVTPDISSTSSNLSITNLVGNSSQRFYRIYRVP